MQAEHVQADQQGPSVFSEWHLVEHWVRKELKGEGLTVWGQFWFLEP